MKEYSWAEVRERAVSAFGGGYPDAELEEELIEVFRGRPAFVVDAVEKVIAGVQAGRVHSPWPLLRKMLERSLVDVVVSDERERELRTRQAEEWLRTAGMYVDREEEIVESLFGAYGGFGGRGQSLRAWAGDEALRTHLLGVWREARLVGEHLEQELRARAGERRETRGRTAKVLAAQRKLGFRGFVGPGEDSEAIE